MCGIAGFLDPHSRFSPSNVVESMSRNLTHRGPDDNGSWVDPETGVALGHCRLSILDLSSAGHQPMLSACERYVLTYNGELYNHVDLRQELEGLGAAPAWRGHSDTETLLAVLAHWGVSDGLKKLNGMFSFGLWDRSDRVLYLARDRMGEKPLYYGLVQGVFMFASELSALAAHPKWHGQIDSTALALFLRFGYVPAPWSIYQGVSKLPPAHYLEIHDLGRDVKDSVPYWNLEDVARVAAATPSHIQPDETVDALQELLIDSVSRRMQADVPVGCFLSGGIDSSVVTAIMQGQSARPVKTFTIGFHEEGFNEAIHAKEVAHHLGTDHTELYVDPNDALAIVPRIPDIWDEPFADPSQIPTFLVSQLAGQQVKVVLSGDGGDELFFGYRRYLRAQRLWSVINGMNSNLKRASTQLLRQLPADRIDELAARLRGNVRPRVAHRAMRLIELMSHETRAAFYEELMSHWSEPSLVLANPATRSTLAEGLDEPWLAGLPEMMMWTDTHSYLPDDILVKVDRASMAVSLEARVPLLDHRLVELAWRTPMRHKRRARTNKWPLRNVLYRYVPRELVDRPKMGFGVPIEGWLRGPLRDWGEELLREDRLRQQGILDPEAIRGAWNAHLSGRGRNHYQLWDVLVFQSWMAATDPTPFL